MVKKTGSFIRFLIKTENVIGISALILITLLPVMEIITRNLFRTGITGATGYILHLVLWITFIGGSITAREGNHLALSIGRDAFRGRSAEWVGGINALVSSAVCLALSVSSLSFLIVGFDPAETIGFIPKQLAVSVIPIGYLLMGIRFLNLRSLTKGPRLLALAAVPLGIAIAFPAIVNIWYMLPFYPPDWVDSLTRLYYNTGSVFDIPMLFLMIGAAFIGTPLFVVLGGIAISLFAGSWGSLEVIPNESYTMLTTQSIAAIPLFTTLGFILSESKAGNRMVDFFREVFSWLPGGLSVVAILVCAFFTTFTGASGVTILALGGILAVILTRSGGYESRFTNGLLTASGSIGLLFPPSLPIILYGVVAQISILDMFVGGVLPGTVIILILAVFAVFKSRKAHLQPAPFDAAAAFKAFKKVLPELLLPVLILVLYFSGFTNLLETGAVAVVYALVVETFVYRDFTLRQIPGVLLKSLPIVGGVLVILAVSRGLSYFLIDANIPMMFTAWVQDHIHSRFVFLLLLNLALLLTGCLMDIYSAITVVVPLIIPLGRLFGIHPVHLGIIFLANLELGYLTPPVGMNLFLASYRFEEPLVKTYRNVLPFFLILLLSVLLITYVPWISTGLLPFFN